MYIKSNWYEKSEYLLLSCVIHFLLLLFLSLHKQNLPLPYPKKNVHIIPVHSPTLSPEKPAPQLEEKKQLEYEEIPFLDAPCVLYKPGSANSSSLESASTPPPFTKQEVKVSLEDTTLEDNAPLKSSTSTNTPEMKDSSSDNKKEDKHPPLATNVQATKDINHAVKNTVVTQVTTPTMLTTELSNFSLQELSGLNEAPPKDSTTFSVNKIIQSESSSSTTSDGTRKRKLTLSDLFKDLGSTPLHNVLYQSDQGQQGEGAPALIVQGDIRYHSFINALLEHINSTFIHRNGREFINAAAQAGKFKKQLLSFTLTLAKNGKVLDARIAPSSGSPEVDKFFIDTAYEASPFAPLPNHFKRDVVKIELSIL